jgi:hypothetical protein
MVGDGVTVGVSVAVGGAAVGGSAVGGSCVAVGGSGEGGSSVGMDVGGIGVSTCSRCTEYPMKLQAMVTKISRTTGKERIISRFFIFFSWKLNLFDSSIMQHHARISIWSTKLD